jgi:hypothetical protein
MLNVEESKHLASARASGLTRRHEQHGMLRNRDNAGEAGPVAGEAPRFPGSMIAQSCRHAVRRDSPDQSSLLVSLVVDVILT